MGLDDAALSEIFDEYDYLDTDGAIAKEELADCLAE